MSEKSHRLLCDMALQSPNHMFLLRNTYLSQPIRHREGIGYLIAVMYVLAVAKDI